MPPQPQPDHVMSDVWTPCRTESSDSAGSYDTHDGTSQHSPQQCVPGVKDGQSKSKSRPSLLHRESSSRSKSYSPGTSSSTSRRPKLKSRRSQRSYRLFCHDCGTTETPEWRTGVNGPGTLCNFCGLIFAKRAEKRMSVFH